MTKVYYKSPDIEKTTRDCLDPWLFTMITADGEVKPCCWHPPIGALSATTSLDDLLNGQQIVQLRRELLLGQLNDNCQICPVRALTDPASLHRRVADALFPSPPPPPPPPLPRFQQLIFKMRQLLRIAALAVLPPVAVTVLRRCLSGVTPGTKAKSSIRG
jgi:hypothetical protein